MSKVSRQIHVAASSNRAKGVWIIRKFDPKRQKPTKMTPKTAVIAIQRLMKVRIAGTNTPNKRIKDGLNTTKTNSMNVRKPKRERRRKLKKTKPTPSR